MGLRKRRANPAVSEIETGVTKERERETDSLDQNCPNAQNVEEETTDSRWRENYGSKRLNDFVFGFRLLVSVVYGGIVLYSCYKLYLASYEFRHYLSHSYYERSWFTTWMNRRKDGTDYEWVLFTEAFSTFSVWKYYVGYVIASRLCIWVYPKGLGWISLPFSLGLIQAVMDPKAGMLLVTIPAIFWVVLRWRHHLLIQLTTISLLIYAYVDPWKTGELANNSDYKHGAAYFLIIRGWFLLRGTSYCFDTLSESGATSFGGLLELIKYTFYFPLTLNGSVIAYNTYRTGMQRRSSVPTNLKLTIQETRVLCLRLLRVLFWFIFIEILLHYLYFRYISWNPAIVNQLDWWSVFGLMQHLNAFMQTKYIVFYGISTAIMGYDGIETLPLPKCNICLHRSSVLWKVFDRGLYNNLVECIYVPTIKYMGQIRWTKNWNTMLKELVASFVTFGFIAGWHAAHHGVFWWVGFNFVAVTIERVGRACRRWIDAKYGIRPVIWDMVIEPIVIIPLTTFTYVTSTIFTGSLGTARIIMERLLTEWPYWWIPTIYLKNNLGVYKIFWNGGRKTKPREPMEKTE